MPTFSIASANTPKPSTGRRMTALTARQTCRCSKLVGQLQSGKNASVLTRTGAM